MASVKLEERLLCTNLILVSFSFPPLQLRWETVDGDTVHLEGPPVFVRVCVLGQLQHTRLHRPLFPLKLNQQLSFDRV